jgi:hypothetical protein
LVPASADPAAMRFSSGEDQALRWVCAPSFFTIIMNSPLYRHCFATGAAKRFRIAIEA